MFYIRNNVCGKLGIVDTKDGVCEYYTPSEVNQISLQIDLKRVADYNDPEMLRFSEKMCRKLYRELARGAVGQHYFDGLAFPLLDTKVTGIVDCTFSVDKIYNYGDTHGFYLLVLHVLQAGLIIGTVFINVNEFGTVSLRVYKENLETRYYPALSGVAYNQLVRRTVGVFPNLASNDIYMLVYDVSKEMAYFLNSVIFDIVYSIKIPDKSFSFK